MNALNPTRCGFSRFAFCFFGLALCVFTWGLQYKLSLYDRPETISRTIPQAKLLSKEEQRTGTESPLVRNDRLPGADMKVVLVSVFVPLLLATFQFVRRWMPRNTELAEIPRNRASLSAFFFRPPPVLA